MSVHARPSRGPRGFTLLELLIAVALMAVLAVLSWRGLDSVLRSRDRIVGASDELRALTVAFAQIEDDLRRSWAVQLLKLPIASTIAFTLDTEGAGSGLEMLRESGGSGEPLQVQRVIYRVRAGVLERGFAAWVDPQSESARASGLPPITWQPLVASVAAIEMRAWVANRGWLSAATLASASNGLKRVADPAPMQIPGSSSATAPAAGGQAAAPGAGGTPPPGAPPVAPTPAGDVILGVEMSLVQRNGNRLLRAFPVKD